MTDQELLKLYRLKGSILGLMDNMKCELHANHDLAQIFPDDRTERWLEGRNQAAVKGMSYLNSLRREVCQIIKEAESERE